MTTFNNVRFYREKFDFYIPSDLTFTLPRFFDCPSPPPPPPQKKISECSLKKQTSKPQPLISSLALSGNGVIGDFSSHIREVSLTSNKIYNTHHPKALASLGFTSAFNMISGGLNMKSGWEEVKAAREVSDTAGQALGAIKIAKGSVFAAGGAAMVPARVLTIVEGVKNASVMGGLAGSLGSSGGSLFTLGSLFAGIDIGFRLHKQRLFRQELFQILNDPHLDEPARIAQASQYLKNMASLSPEERVQISKEMKADPNYQELPPDEKLRELIKKETQMLSQKEALFKRVLDSGCLDLIRTNGADDSAIVQAAKKASLKRVILQGSAMALICIGIALFIASFIFSTPFALMVTAIISLVVSMGWLVLDGYELINNFKQSDPGRFDKLWILLSSVIAVVAVGLVFFLTAGFAPLIAASSVGIVWLAVNAFCYYRLYQAEKTQTPKPLESQGV